MRIAVPLVLTATLALAGCGAETSGTGSADEPVRGTRAVGGETELTVVVQPGDRLAKRTFSLTCDPPGGDHPDAADACAALAALEDPFAPVPPDLACTEIYGGPQTAKVTGTFRGEPVSAKFNRTDGCQIARWDAHAELLVVAGGPQHG